MFARKNDAKISAFLDQPYLAYFLGHYSSSVIIMSNHMLLCDYLYKLILITAELHVVVNLPNKKTEAEWSEGLCWGGDYPCLDQSGLALHVCSHHPRIVEGIFRLSSPCRLSELQINSSPLKTYCFTYLNYQFYCLSEGVRIVTRIHAL